MSNWIVAAQTKPSGFHKLRHNPVPVIMACLLSMGLGLGACAKPQEGFDPPIKATQTESKAVDFLKQDDEFFVKSLKNPAESHEGVLLEPKLQWVLENVTRPQSNPTTKAQLRAFHALPAGRQITRNALDRYWANHTAPNEGVSHEDRLIRLGQRDVKIRILTPDTLKGQSSRPSLIYYHGGGFMFGSIQGFDPSVRALAKLTNRVAIMVDYALTPEFAYPTAHDEAEQLFLWLKTQSATMGLDPQKIILSGDSAGGNLALSVSLRQGAQNKPRPQALLIFYPGVDKSHDYPSMKTLGSGYGLDTDTMTYLGGLLYPDTITPKIEDSSPIESGYICSLPPTVLVSAGFDPLLDSQRAFVNKANDKGVKITHIHAPSLIHGFLQTTAYVAKSQQALEEAASATNTALLAKPPLKNPCN